MKLQGIYFIYESSVLVYVGKTTNLWDRFRNHKSATIGRYYKFLPVQNKSNMALLELAYIGLYKPAENKQDKFNSESSIVIDIPSIDHLEVTLIQRANKQGTKLMKSNLIADIFLQLGISRSYAALNHYILCNTGRYNIVVKKGSSEPATVAYLAKRLDVTERTINNYLRDARKIDFIRKVGNILRVNPFVIIPYTQNESYTTNDQIASQLQAHWTLDDNTIPSVLIVKEEDLEHAALVSVTEGEI